MDNRPIGVFDSGVGGLSILIELKKLMPKEDYVFVADQKNVPYGEKTPEQLNFLTKKIVGFLLNKDVKAVVVACNTATCYCIEDLRHSFNIPFVGTVPAIKPAAQISKNKKIAVISTPATSKSTYLGSLITKFAGNVEVLNIGCPELENTVEEGQIESSKTISLLERYLEPIKKFGSDTIVLGCTHYPFLKKHISRYLGPNVSIVDSGKAIALRTYNVLSESKALNNGGGSSLYFTTSDKEVLSRPASTLLREDVKVKKIFI